MTSVRPVAMVYCQVSFGIGHWMRLASLLEPLRERFQVVLFMGGRFTHDLTIPDGVEVIQLPGRVREDDDEYVAVDEGATLAEVSRLRRMQLVAEARRLQPDVIVIEYFPFGRHESLYELVHLLDEATRRLSRRPLIVCSLRDIQQRARPDQQRFDRRVSELCNRYFDAVLVHADPQLARFDETFLAANDLRVPVFHTGYVVIDEPQPEPQDRAPLVLVSAGGGRGGEALLRLAIETMRVTDLPADFAMRVIAGTFQSEDVWRDLQQAAQGVPGLELLRWVPNLRSELLRAAVSVSRCGYNTALDLVRTRTPALVVPFWLPDEDEQTNRAARLERLGAVRVLAESEATPERLAEEIRRTARFHPAAAALDINGARRSVEVIESLLSAPRSRTPA